MKVLITIWISAVLIQEVIPSTLVRLPRQTSNGSSLVHTEYEAKYEQRGKHGNESFSRLSGKQQFVQDNCSENWNAFADKCASLIKDLVASLANAVSSKPGDATKLQLHIKNTFRHFDKTHNCSTCLNHAGKGPSELDLSPFLNNIKITTVGPNENSEIGNSDGSGDNQPSDPDCNAEGKVIPGPTGVAQKKDKPSSLVENLDMHPSNADSEDDESIKNNRRQVKCPAVSKQPETLHENANNINPSALESKPSPSNCEQPQNGKNVLHPIVVTPLPPESPEGPIVCGDPPFVPGNSLKDSVDQSPGGTLPDSSSKTGNDIPPSASQVLPFPGNGISDLKSKDTCSGVVNKPQQSGNNDSAPYSPRANQKQPSTVTPVINSSSNLPEHPKQSSEEVKVTNPIPIYEVVPITPGPQPSSKLVTQSPAILSTKGNDLSGFNNEQHRTNQHIQRTTPATRIPSIPAVKDGEKLIGIVVVTPTPITDQHAKDYGYNEKDTNNETPLLFNTPSNTEDLQDPSRGKPDTGTLHPEVPSPSVPSPTESPHQAVVVRPNDGLSTDGPQSATHEPNKSLITPIIDYLVKIFPLKPGNSNQNKECDPTDSGGSTASPKHIINQSVTDSNSNQEHPQSETPKSLGEPDNGKQPNEPAVTPAVIPQGESQTGPSEGSRNPNESEPLEEEITPTLSSAKLSEHSTTPGVTLLEKQRVTLVPNGKEQIGEDPVLKPTTFQTTSAEPTPLSPAYQYSPQSTKSFTHTSFPQDSDETLPMKPITSSETPAHHDDDDDEECCSCESCTEEEITDPKQYKENACKDLEEARKELKKIFDKIKKTLKCGRKAPQRITTSCSPRSNPNMKRPIGSP